VCVSRITDLFGSPNEPISQVIRLTVDQKSYEAGHRVFGGRGQGVYQGDEVVVGDLAQVTRLSQVDQEFAVVKVVERGDAL
jgi:hypothetical protein